MSLSRTLRSLVWRLDGQMERRMIAIAACLALASLAFGPAIFRAVAQTGGGPQLVVQPVDPAPGATSLTLRAGTSGANFQLVEFRVLKDGDTAPTVYVASPIQSGLWQREGVPVIPGTTYHVRAHGVVPPNATNPTAIDIVTDPPVSFTVPTVQTGPVCGDNVCAATESTATCAVDCPATTFCGDNVCQANESSTSCSADCGAAAEPAPEPDTGTSAPLAKLEFMTPAEGQTFAGPAPLRVRVVDGEALSVLFDVVGPAGALPTVTPSLVDGVWSASFTSSPGLYAYMARATLREPSGVTIITPNARGFTLVAPPPASDTTGTATSTGTAPPAEETFPTPAVDMVAPAEGSSFSGPVPLAAMPRNGEVGSLRFNVRNIETGADTVVLANRMANGAWAANFEGPPGPYRAAARATFAGPIDVDSTPRGFMIVGQAVPPPTTTTATSTTTLPPPPPPPPLPPPPPTTTTATTTTTLPPPPPPPPPPATTGTTPPPPSTATVPPLASATPTAPTTVAATRTAPIDVRRLPTELQADYAADIPPTLVLECRTSGILPERCRSWLAAKYQDRACLGAGATTREACAALRQASGAAADDRALFGLATKAEIADVRERVKGTFGAPTAVRDLPREVEALLPFATDRRAEAVLTLPSGSDARLGERSAVALVVLDADADGLPDDVERRIGSDPDDADSDDDGFLDGVEVRNGYDPAGPGRLTAPPRGVEAAILAGAAIEEPAGAETTDDAFVVDEAAPAADEAGTDVVRLSGRAAPNTVVTLFIYSYLPVVVTTTTDADGNWRYDFSSRLAEGRHEAYVAVNDDTGKLVAASRPLAFFIKEAQAVSEEDFLRPDVNVEEAPAVHVRTYVIGGIVLVLLALVLTVAIVRQVRSNPIEPPQGGAV